MAYQRDLPESSAPTFKALTIKGKIQGATIMKTPLPRGKPGGGGKIGGNIIYPAPCLVNHLQLQGRLAALSMIASYITICESTMFVYVLCIVVVQQY